MKKINIHCKSTLEIHIALKKESWYKCNWWFKISINKSMWKWTHVQISHQRNTNNPVWGSIHNKYADQNPSF